MARLVVTNNPMVRDQLSGRFDVRFVEGSLRDALVTARGLVHTGCVLLSHPLSGSVKPNETPFKSVMLQQRSGPVDAQSLEIIENSIQVCDKFPVKYPDMTDEMREDFSLIDYTLFTSGLERA